MNCKEREDRSSVTLAPGQSVKIRGTVKKLQKGKKLISADHASKVRCLSGNEGVATVTKSGKITGVSAGTCTVYVYTTNGIRKTVSVTVQ